MFLLISFNRNRGTYFSHTTLIEALQCTMGYALLKSGNMGIYQNDSLRPHFYESKLFQTKYLEILLCSVSLLLYTWGLVEHSQLQKEDLQ